MAEYEYHPDLCLLCPRDIEQDDAVVIVDDVISRPRYMHLRCFLESPQLAADTCRLILSKRSGQS